MALRVAKSRSRCASGEKREPMILTPSNPASNSRVRRMRNALTIVSPSSGSSSTARRSSPVLSSQHPSIGSGARRHQRAPAGEHVHVAGELARLVHHDRVRRAARVLDDLDLAIDHDEEAEVAVAFGEQDFAGADVAGMPPGRQRGEILGAQDRKGDFLIVGHRKLSVVYALRSRQQSRGTTQL